MIGVVVAGIWVVLTLSTLVQPQGPTSARWVADLRTDRALLGTMLWTAAFAVVLGGVLGVVAAAAPKLLATPAAWVTDMFAAIPMILVPFLAATPFESGGIRIALGLVGAARVARPVARSMAERDGRVGWARLLARPLAAGAASVASFTAFVVSVIGLVAAAVA